ncbi:unnamed protein product, partial [Ectocarpus sp. 13 AM-2016]
APLSSGGRDRQRRRVARVNYAEDNDVDSDEDAASAGGGGQGGGRGAKKSKAVRSGRNAPLPLKDEVRRGVAGEEVLPGDVREFRRVVRSAVKGISKEEFTLHFRDAVDLVAYPQYTDIVKEPVDLARILFKLRQGEYDSQEGRKLLLRDINLIPENCETFNGKGVQ